MSLKRTYRQAYLRQEGARPLKRQKTRRAFPEIGEKRTMIEAFWTQYDTSIAKRHKTGKAPPNLSLFLNLPREIRDMIYGYALSTEAENLSRIRSIEHKEALDIRAQHKLVLQYQQAVKFLGEDEAKRICKPVQQDFVLVDTALFAICKQIKEEVDNFILDTVDIEIEVFAGFETTTREFDILALARYPGIKTNLPAEQLRQHRVIKVLKKRVDILGFYFLGISDSDYFDDAWPPAVLHSDLIRINYTFEVLRDIKVNKGITIRWLWYEEVLEYCKQVVTPLNAGIPL